MSSRLRFLFTRPKKVCYSEEIPWDQIKRIIFICKGNICRSAYAEARLKNLGFKNVISFGTNATTGSKSTQVAQKKALNAGIDLSVHSATSLDEFVPRKGDLVLAFELCHLINIPEIDGIYMSLVGLFHYPKFPHIEDPYGLSELYYETCFDRIDRALIEIFNKLNPKRKNILVVEADTMGALAVVRSLGRAGHNVYSVSQKKNNLAKHSKYSKLFEPAPLYTSDEFKTWLERIVQKHSIDFIIPSESFLLAIKDDLNRWLPFLPVPGNSDETLKGMSKVELFKTSKEHESDPHLPKHFIVDSKTSSEVLKGINDFKFPVFLKGDALYSNSLTQEGCIFKIQNNVEINSACKKMSEEFSQYLITEFISGIGVGVFFLIWDGVIIADFMHLRSREVPYQGGVSSCRESFFNQEIYNDAVSKIRSMKWQGVAMMEYRWNSKTDEFFLMEMNGRFWGSLHLPIYAGVDFPKLLITCMSGHSKSASCEARLAKWKNKKTVCRHLAPLEIQNIWSVFKSSEKSVIEKVKHSLLWIKDSCDPRVFSDLGSFPGDRYLFILNFIYFFQNLLKAIGFNQENK